jgi:hypothetical protein
MRRSRLHEYCEARPVPEAGNKLPKLRTFDNWAFHLADFGAPAPDRGSLHGLMSMDSREGD